MYYNCVYEINLYFLFDIIIVHNYSSIKIRSLFLKQKQFSVKTSGDLLKNIKQNKRNKTKTVKE